jgi:uncharacterized membrane protein required for colicin V production
MLMLGLAVLLALAFQASVLPNATLWTRNSNDRKLTSLLALFVFLLWCAIAVAGRWIAYLRVE